MHIILTKVAELSYIKNPSFGRNELVWDARVEMHMEKSTVPHSFC